jgi:hypothetical protein
VIIPATKEIFFFLLDAICPAEEEIYNKERGIFHRPFIYIGAANSVKKREI